MNRLAAETSPYLLQHADNPVDWYAWGDEALQRAKKEDKPILLSVGYSACHWCHVMAHESFENEATAKLMNAHFVNVKIDREERPDLDQLYQGVVQLMGRGGGWPLTAGEGAADSRRGVADAGEDGPGWNLRPARRRLLPLQRRRALGGAALREDALRQRAAAPSVRGGLADRSPAVVEEGRRRDGGV